MSMINTNEINDEVKQEQLRRYLQEHGIDMDVFDIDLSMVADKLVEEDLTDEE